VAVRIVYETHSTSENNEQDIATGWLGGCLSRAGREQARRLGDRRRDDGIDLVIASDLNRAVETAQIAFEGSRIPVRLDWRLRECDYGEMNGMPRSHLESERGSTSRSRAVRAGAKPSTESQASSAKSTRLAAGSEFSSSAMLRLDGLSTITSVAFRSKH